MRKLFLLSISVLALLHAHSQAGDLDKSFAGKGWTPVDFIKGNLYDEYGTQVLKTHNDYTVVFEINGYTYLARYEPDGKLDDDFASGGFSDPVNIGDAKAVVQADGKIVLAGLTYNPATNSYDFAVARFNDNGTLDKSFSSDGKLTTNFFDDDDIATSIAVQSNGKIVVGGFAYNPATGNYDFALARYNTNGSLDNSFDGDGKQTTDFFGEYDNAVTVLIQSDGKILAVGQAYNPAGGNDDFALARYNPDGSLDNSFDGDGLQSTDFFGSYDVAASAIIQPDGRILVVGFAENSISISGDLALARFNTDGSLATSLDGDGKFTGYYPAGYSQVNAIAVQSNGKVVVGGFGYNPATNSQNFALARFNTDGKLDKDFSGDGKLTLDFSGGFDEEITSIAIQSNGKIVVCGRVYNPATSNYDFALARFNTNGSLDNSFDGDGKQTTDFFSTDDIANSMIIQSNGKIVVGGYVYNPATLSVDFGLARYNPDGSLDNSFNGVGLQVADFLASDDFCSSIALQSNGKIVAGGYAYNPTSFGADFAVARFNTDGSLDNSFDGDGKLTTDVYGNDDRALSVLVQTNGKIVAVGYAYRPSTDNYDFALMRYNSNGSRDNSFDGNGRQSADFYGGDDGAFAAALQSNGKIVAAGTAEHASLAGFDFALARFNTNGALDHSFDDNGEQSTDFYGAYEQITGLAIKGSKAYAGGVAEDPILRGIVAVYLLGSGSTFGIEAAEDRPALQEVVTQAFTVKALPNPTTQYFTVSLQSSTNTPLTVTVTDVLGRRIEARANMAANGSLQFGHKYAPGVYYAEIVQGSERTVLKLVKQ